jgi:choline dehydrogenase-like flavoprotein
MNFMLHYAGSEEDFTRWENSGATGWGFGQLQPYLLKMLGTEHKCITQQPHCPNSYQILLMSAAGLHPTSVHQKGQKKCVTVKVFYCNSYRYIHLQALY